MNSLQSLEFEHTDRETIYDYVERAGRVDRGEAQEEVLPHDPGGFRHHVGILKRNGFLEESADGELSVALDVDGTEEFAGDEFCFEVRPANQGDLTGIVGAIRQVAQEGRYIVAESVAQELDHQDVLLRQNELESRMFFVATVKDEVVAWVYVHAPELDKLSHTAELTVGVIEEYRGNGLGTHLLERGLEWAASNGYEKVYQSIPATNDAAAEFLEQHGWETEAIRRDHYRINGEYVDELMMAIQL